MAASVWKIYAKPHRQGERLDDESGRFKKQTARALAGDAGRKLNGLMQSLHCRLGTYRRLQTNARVGSYRARNCSTQQEGAYEHV